MNRDESFDVGLMSEMMARQEADARRIVMLCDVVSKQALELREWKAKAPKSPEGPPPEAKA